MPLLPLILLTILPQNIPCAMVLMLRALPGVPGLIASVARECVHGLDPSVGRSGPHDLAVRLGRRSSGETQHVHRTLPQRS